VSVDWTSERPDSVIRQVTIEDAAGRRPVIVKRHRQETDPNRSAGTRARYEHDILTMLRASMSDAYTVPRPLLVDDPSGAIVIERASGEALDAMIGRSKRSAGGARTLPEPLRRAGAWLRLMHHSTATQEDGATLLQNVVDRALADVDHLATHDWRIRRRRAPLTARLHELARRVPTRPVTGHHGDYWAGNIFMSDARVDVIDFEGYRRGLPLEDVAYFLVSLDLLFPRFRNRLPPLREAFLDGYFDGAPRDDLSLQLFTLTKTLYALGRGPGAQHPLPLRLWIRHMHREIVFRALG
jgi:Ser/Thr protein kinase RdoA (MazF antagonist)